MFLGSLKHKYMPDEICLCLSEIITDNQIESGQLKPELKEMVMYTLLRKHRHQTKKSNLRSLADIGKSVSSASRLFSSQENGNTAATLNLSLTLYRFPHLSSHFHDQHLSAQSIRTSLTHFTKGCIHSGTDVF